MHRNGVAHLDIKPQNIVVRNDDRLFIIDFDLSLRVDGPDHLIDTWCGTTGWMAPDIGKRNGPRHLYSPIRADLWSCGQVISYLMAESNEVVDEELKTLARRLSHKNLRYRHFTFTFYYQLIDNKLNVGYPCKSS
jgi:serine/threonine protein kinase